MDDCMRYAVKNSPAVRKEYHAGDTYKAEQLSALGAFLPSVSANVGTQFSYGRSIDPETNTYNNTSTFNNAYGLSVSLPLFSGGRLVNRWKAAKVGRLLGKQAVRLAEDELAINVMQAYIDVVFYNGTVKLAAEKLEESARLLYKTRRMEELGLKGKADVAQIEAQAASDDYELTHRQNLYATALLTLKEYMNCDSSLPFRIDTTLAEQERLPPGEPAEAVYRYASEHNPLARQAALNLESMKLKRRIAGGDFFPTLSFSASVSTNYFENLRAEAAPAAFKSQFWNNRGEYFSFNVSLPVFDGFARRTEFRRARNNMRIAGEQQTEALRRLQTTIEKAVTDCEGYLKEITQMEKQAEANELAYRLTCRKYEEGLLSPLDLQVSSNQLAQSKVNLLQRKLLYIVKVREVKYYRGETLIPQEGDPE
jgi:outer membrane protein